MKMEGYIQKETIFWNTAPALGTRLTNWLSLLCDLQLLTLWHAVGVLTGELIFKCLTPYESNTF